MLPRSNCRVPFYLRSFNNFRPPRASTDLAAAGPALVFSLIFTSAWCDAAVSSLADSAQSLGAGRDAGIQQRSATNLPWLFAAFSCLTINAQTLAQVQNNRRIRSHKRAIRIREFYKYRRRAKKSVQQTAASS
jgi:hypothetical protein